LKNVEGVLSRGLQTVNFLAHDIRLSARLKERAKFKMLGGLRVGDGKGSEASIGNSRRRQKAPWGGIHFNSRDPPDEVKTLRQVYSSSFSAILVYESRDRRMASPCDKITRYQLLSMMGFI
jgi:hypothetical protein